MPARKKPVLPDVLVDQLMSGRDPSTVFDKNGLLDELERAIAERALNAEMDHHLVTEAADGGSNSRNGYGKKTVLTDTGKLGISVPRDRLSTFDPQLIAKYRRRLPGFDEKIVSMYARGMTVREIRGHLDEIYGVDVSPELISAVTDDILDEVAEWWVRGDRGRRPRKPLERRSRTSIRWFSSMPCGSRFATKAWSATRPSMLPWASGSTVRRRSSASGSSKPRAPNSGCGS